ncbi:MAG TPA: glycosyltransferase family 2 protein [Candidatus Melainabacteria bacterium]|jgi:dolichol-phosphate mannosyltransferase|nr:glycosyltransferase family 2 protein [Candidatus Melainabacteria bacterium]HIN64226.1 glycosyltransferase family 2 protein [Candidatus Obscuribacterales bacterium]
MSELALVIPVYNEEGTVKDVIDEWYSMLLGQQIDFNLFVLNDGSTDGTRADLDEMQAKLPLLKVIHKENSGHGQTCIAGYRAAIDSGAVWIMQIDSDGQCETKYFPEFWKAREQGVAVMGFRVNRDDGLDRTLISRVLTFTIFLLSSVYVKDSNVPYRLMHRIDLAEVISKVPPTFYLANVLVSLIYQKRFRIKWLSIGFRERPTGKPKANHARMLELAFDLMKDIVAIRSKI